DRTLDRGFRKPAGAGKPLAEPDDAREGVDHMERVRRRMRDQKAAVVGAEIEGGVKRLLRSGKNPCTGPFLPSKARPAPATPPYRRWASRAARAPRAFVRHATPFPPFPERASALNRRQFSWFPPVGLSLPAQGLGATRWNRSKRGGSPRAFLKPCTCGTAPLLISPKGPLPKFGCNHGQSRTESRDRSRRECHRQRAHGPNAVLSSRTEKHFSGGHLRTHDGIDADRGRLSRDVRPHKKHSHHERRRNARENRPLPRIYPSPAGRKTPALESRRQGALLRQSARRLHAQARARPAKTPRRKVQPHRHVSDSDSDARCTRLQNRHPSRHALEGHDDSALSSTRRIDQSRRHGFPREDRAETIQQGSADVVL